MIVNKNLFLIILDLPEVTYSLFIEEFLIKEVKTGKD
jgi:hypothetical protein